MHNPFVNLTHAQQTLIDQLATDLADRDDTDQMPTWVSYRMVERLVREKIIAQGDIGPSFQFCLCLPDISTPVDFTKDVALQSPLLRLDHE
jgi:hypothetical protein